VKKWQPLADYLAKEVDMPVEMVFRRSYVSLGMRFQCLAWKL